ncbi:MAG: hypothetical protein PUB20_01420 [Clostridia bacterium]|nr:hypothetical protein [Clostridia bacterium]
MNYWDVKDYLSQLIDLTEDETLVASVCRTALREIEAGLKKDADFNDVRIVAAAAGLAYYRLMLRRNSLSQEDSVMSFKAGDVSITQDSADTAKQLERAEIYCAKMFEKIAPLCEDNSFAFIKTGVNVDDC